LGRRKWDEPILDAMRRGVATRTALARETRIGQDALDATLRRLRDEGKIKVVTKGWYTLCPSSETDPASPAAP